MTAKTQLLLTYRKAAEALLAQGCVKEIEFSGATYQVRIEDPDSHTDVWAFVQLDERGSLRDCFCSCESEDEEASSCVHIAAAFLRIYNQKPTPLHKRFAASLWNTLCLLYATRLGYKIDILKKMDEGHYRHSSISGKVIFYIKAVTPKGLSTLKNLLQEHPQETETTSLKFSGRSPEEILLWREGKPSPQFGYELSFWSDIAKWLMIMQEEAVPYKLSFDYSPTQLPAYIHIDFPDVELGFYLSEANLPALIQAFTTVETPFVVHNQLEKGISSIHYDEVKAEMHVSFKTPSEAQQKSKSSTEHAPGYSLQGWTYVPGDGFYPGGEQRLLRKSILTGEEITKVLNEHAALIGAKLNNAKVYDIAVQPSYHTYFDRSWNLHFTLYAFEKGDLTKPHSKCFGDWVYLEEDGFYPMGSNLFNAVEKVIPAQEVSDFVTLHRTWLNTQEGFHTHLASVEAQLTYSLDAYDRLAFNSQADIPSFSNENKDFGTWLYIANQGFYSKVSTLSLSPIRPGLVLSRDQIPLFIRMHKDELHFVAGFFSDDCPVSREGLKVELNEREVISCTPHYEVLDEYKNKNLRFFDNYVYIPEKGFHEIPVDPHIAERFQERVEITPEEHALFLTYDLEILKPFIADIDPRLVKPLTLDLVTTHIDVTEMHNEDYTLHMHYATELGTIDVATIWKKMRQKKRFLFSKAGLLDLEDTRFKWLKQINKEHIDAKNNVLSLSTLELLRLNAFDEINLPKQRPAELASDTAFARTRQLLIELKEFTTPDAPELSGLTSQLRPYQSIGVQWLWFLYHHHLSGLLCDDMGLGKTHQTMGLLAAVINHHKKQAEERRFYFLVVCPTSVMYHWQEKLKAFLPDLRVCTFYGLDRTIEGFTENYDVLLTSYGIWRRESKVLGNIPFEVVIFDEIQIAKNHMSRLHSTLLNTQARMKIGLTGTPIENRLRELKSLFDIVLPSYMPGDSDFTSFFVKPIEKDNSQDRSALLTRFIKPFILRRKKEDVLLDLPEKTEQISHCALSQEQHQLYQELLQQTRSRLIQELQNESSPIPYMHIFAVLSSLKQICNHPAAYFKNPDQYKQHESGKWELFVELLNEARESQQKVVVFSQYLAMLDIIGSYLKEHNIAFATIRGSTQDRSEQLRKFNQDPQCEVFVASLQASGLGIDLTAASVVIHYDRWWNAARENQATDRVHRIGQTRGVQVFKLVTKGTFEERIDELITKKGQLMEEIVGTDDHNMLKRFNRQDLIGLLQDVSVMEI